MTKHPFRYILVGLFLLTFSVSHAFAQGVPDPVTTATTATDAGLAMLTQYGPIWGGMLLVYGIASSLLRYNQSTHWIAQGRTLAMITAGLGVAAAALSTHFSGGQWSAVAITAVLAVFKLVNPTISRSPQTGFVSRWLMGYLAVFGVLLVVSAAPSCSAAQKADEHTALVCAENAAVKDLTPTVASILANGTATWEAQLAALGVAFGTDVINCAVTSAKSLLIAKSGAGSAADQTALQRADAWLKGHGGS